MPQKQADTGKRLVVVRIRGAPKMSNAIQDTLRLLNLKRKHACAIVPDTQSYRGMITKVKSYVAWGEINEETIKKFEGNGKKGASICLPPAKKGFGRKGIKLPFTTHGCHGYCGEKINDLLVRMV